jgi:2-polyprenyl-3-methyl-5-hydroxy-6-metoxy-1,4-benzoquinol methylase
MALLSPYIKRQRLEMALPWIRGDVLELGCGLGDTLHKLEGKFNSYTGVDYRADLIAEMSRRHSAHRFLTRNLDDERLDTGQQYDTILMLALLEHLYNIKHVMSEVKNSLRQDGNVVITTPTPLGNDIVHRAGASVGLFSRLAAEDHVTIYNRRRFEIMARDIGFSIANYKTFQFACNQLVILKHA